MTHPRRTPGHGSNSRTYKRARSLPNVGAGPPNSGPSCRGGSAASRGNLERVATERPLQTFDGVLRSRVVESLINTRKENVIRTDRHTAHPLSYIANWPKFRFRPGLALT